MLVKNVVIGVVTLTLIVPSVSSFSLLTPTSVAAQFSAPGNPYTDCNYERPLAVQLARGLFGLDERIARTQRWLDGASRNAGHLEREALAQASSAKVDLASDVGFMTLKATAVRAALKSIPASPYLNRTRDLLFQDLDGLEIINNGVKVALAAGNFQVASKEAARLANQARKLDPALVARALTDAGVTGAMAAKVAGPYGAVAELAVTVGVMGIDAIEASWAADITDREIADAKQTLEILNDQKSKIMQQVEKVVADCGPENQNTENRPADSPQPTPPPDAVGPASSGGGGISGGAVAGIIAAGASIPIGVWAYEEYKKTLDDGGTGGGNTGGGNTGGGNTGGGAIATTVSGASITCTLGSAGSLTHCTGTLTARIGPSVTAGVRVTAHTEPVNIQGHAVPTTTGTGQTLVFVFTNVTGVGCQPLRTLRFTKQSDPNTVFTSWNGTINITCR